MAEENNRLVTCCPQDVLKKVCPDAKVEGMDADGNMVTGAAAETVWLVPCDEIESISQVLKEKAGMDFLRDLMGTDEGEGRTGVYYFMERTSDGVNIILREKTGMAGLYEKIIYLTKGMMPPAMKRIQM